MLTRRGPAITRQVTNTLLVGVAETMRAPSGPEGFAHATPGRTVSARDGT
jgi:hypothetical protein